MADPLARLKRAAKRKQAAELEYRAAILAAADAGHSYAELARALGLTRQTTRILVERERARQGPRCPKCGMLEHKPDQWCDAQV